MKELLLLLRETAAQALRIATFRSTGADLPDSKGFAIWSAILSAAFVAAEQWARGHGVVGMLIAPAAWLFVVGLASREEEAISYKIASALFLGMLPVCAVFIAVAGNDLLEWVVAAWGACVAIYVLGNQHREWSPWH